MEFGMSKICFVGLIMRGETLRMYKLPEGIRIPEENEYPNGINMKEITLKRDSAKIIEGYRIKEVENNNYSFFAEINVDCDKIWELFLILSNRILSDISYGILAFKQEEPVLSNFTEKSKIINIFDKYKFELTNDGYLEFGIAYYDDFKLDEIYVASFKYLKVWGSNKEKFGDVMKQFKLEEHADLNFIDEFPVVSMALQSDMVKHHTDIIKELTAEFDSIS